MPAKRKRAPSGGPWAQPRASRPALAVALTWGLGCQDPQSSMVIISWWCGGGHEVKGAAASAGLRSGTLELGDGSARHCVWPVRQFLPDRPCRAN